MFPATNFSFFDVRPRALFAVSATALLRPGGIGIEVPSFLWAFQRDIHAFPFHAEF